MRGFAELKSMYIPLRQAGRSENHRRGVSDWTKWATLGHYQIVSQTLPLILVILVLSYCNTSPTTGLAACQAGEEDVNNPLCSSWLSFSLHPRTSFFPSILNRCPPFAAPQWYSLDLDWEIYRQHRERPAGCCGPHSLTKKAWCQFDAHA